MGKIGTLHRLQMVVGILVGCATLFGAGWSFARWFIVPMLLSQVEARAVEVAKAEVTAYTIPHEAEKDSLIRYQRRHDSLIQADLDSLQWEAKYQRAFARASDPDAAAKADREMRFWRQKHAKSP